MEGAGGASSSIWQWDPTLGVYHNPITRQWATPRSDHTWAYSGSPPPPASPAAHGPSTRGKDVQTVEEGEFAEQAPSESEGVDAREAEEVEGSEEGELDGLPVALPEDQVWPGEEEDHLDDNSDHLLTPLLRLIVLASPVLAAGSVAIVPPSTPVSIGRDKAFAERLRVKELMVSKTHATVFNWDSGDSERMWAIADCGSMYGTWVKRHGEPSYDRGEDKDKGTRLSKSKVASGPRELHHLDKLTVGTTTFLVHIHPSGLPCTDCSVKPDESNLISLLVAPSSSMAAVSSTASATSTGKTKAEKEQDRREEMQNLKKRFLAPPRTSSNSPSAPPPKPVKNKPQFQDRAAARRLRTSGPSHMGPSPPPPFFTVPGTTSHAQSTTFARPQPPLAEPFGATSKGALLLSKLSGGTGPSGEGLGKLIEPKSGGKDRAGLGASGADGAPSGEKRKGSWREQGLELNRKRFRALERT